MGKTRNHKTQDQYEHDYWTRKKPSWRRRKAKELQPYIRQPVSARPLPWRKRRTPARSLQHQRLKGCA